MTPRATNAPRRDRAERAIERRLVASRRLPTTHRAFSAPLHERGFSSFAEERACSSPGATRASAGTNAQRGLTLPSAQRGFTLIELMLVIAIMALLLGVGLGVFARLDLGDRVSVSLVESALRSAHNWAVARPAPARVDNDVKNGTFRTEGLAVIGTWHFEKEPIEGAFGLDGAMSGGKLIEDGFQGRALSFAGEPSRSHLEIPVQQDPSYDLRPGFTLRCALRVESGRGGDLLKIGDSVGLDVTEHGCLQGWIVPEGLDEQGLAQRGGRIPIQTPNLALPAARWCQVEMRYDRSHLELLVDGTLVARVAETTPVWKIEGPLVISPSNAPFQGAIDNLVICAVAGEEEHKLPKNVAFSKGTPRQIVFAAGGELDHFVHREPLRVGLEFEDGREVPILVNLYGTVE
jgi:prepilin-type N-terminal cleavage/methylation domain-containing protein